MSLPAKRYRQLFASGSDTRDLLSIQIDHDRLRERPWVRSPLLVFPNDHLVVLLNADTDSPFPCIAEWQQVSPVAHDPATIDIDRYPAAPLVIGERDPGLLDVSHDDLELRSQRGYPLTQSTALNQGATDQHPVGRLLRTDLTSALEAEEGQPKPFVRSPG